MKSSSSILDVALIVREFVQNEARTIEISKGKMLKEEDAKQKLAERYRRVS